MDNKPTIEITTTEGNLEKLRMYSTVRGRAIKVNVKGNISEVKLPQEKLFDALKDAHNNGAAINFNNFEDSARFGYYGEFKDIVNASDSTVNKIIALNREEGRNVSIAEIKEKNIELFREIEACRRKNTLDETIRQAKLKTVEAQKKALVKKKLRKAVETEGRGMQI